MVIPIEPKVRLPEGTALRTLADSPYRTTAHLGGVKIPIRKSAEP